MRSLIKVIPTSFRDRYRSNWLGLKLEAKTNFAKIRRQFVRPSFPSVEGGKLNLHLGCGSVTHPKFINIDGLPGKHIHYVRPINNLCPFQDNTVDFIYACHCLEHFPYAKVPQVLSEWLRVLKKGGILQLSVPDFDLLLTLYHENGNEIGSILGFLMGGQDYKFNFHMTVFNQLSLSQLLHGVGFTHVQEWQPGSSEMTTFDDHSNFEVYLKDKLYKINLNLQAIK